MEKLKGKLTQIMEKQKARGRGIKAHAPEYIRLTFKMEDGSWAKTDVCPAYRNFKNWKPIIDAGVGVVIGGMRYRVGKEVNADSPVYIHTNQELFAEEFAKQKAKDEDTGQQALFGEEKKSNTGDFYDR